MPRPCVATVYGNHREVARRDTSGPGSVFRQAGWETLSFQRVRVQRVITQNFISPTFSSNPDPW